MDCRTFVLMLMCQKRKKKSSIFKESDFLKNEGSFILELAKSPIDEITQLDFNFLPLTCGLCKLLQNALKIKKLNIQNYILGIFIHQDMNADNVYSLHLFSLTLSTDRTYTTKLNPAMKFKSTSKCGLNVY